jgi:hypothetical protein
MPQAPNSAPSSDPSPSQASAHLAQLHRMSTTAGVTNLDYVAVNQLAIAAVFIGLASALALFGWLLLIVPVVGIVFSVVAIQQINDSSGTQTGKWLAIGGLALCLLFAGVEIIQEWSAYTAVRDDKRQVAATLSQAGDLIRQHNYKEAYDLFDPRFRQSFRLESFQATWILVQSPQRLGTLQSMRGNDLVQFQTAGGDQLAQTNAIIKFSNVQEERFEVTLHQVNGKWLILRLPSFFAERKDKNKADDFNI